MATVDEDLARDRPMQRLLMGEVGSGKTVVALYAMLRAVESGAQAALMAPTETLAEQHFATLQKLMPGELVQAALLTGSTPAARRTDLLGKLASRRAEAARRHARADRGGGRVRPPAAWSSSTSSTASASTSAARWTARRRPGLAPHVLHMTATPIPRTLALTAYGDLDVTVLRELPAGPAADRDVRRLHRARARAGLRAHPRGAARRPPGVRGLPARRGVRGAAGARGHGGVRAAARPASCRDFRVVLMHGQMRPREKQEAMAAFAAGGADVLVATTVIEVGIDVPNATVMLVEDAERYGISQLHQLRGRIGRGAARLAVPAVRPQGVRAAARARRAHATASSSPRSTSSCAARGRCSARASPGCARSSSRGCPRTRSCSSAPAMRAREILDDDPALARARARAARGRRQAAYGADALEPIPA